MLFHCKLLYGQIDFYDHNEAIDLINRAQNNIEQGEFSLAINNLTEAIKLDSTIRGAYILINQAAFELGDILAQKEILFKAKKLFTDDDEFCYYLGRIYQKEDLYDKAIGEYNEAIKFSKVNGEDFELVYEYYANRGICFLKKEEYDKAHKDFDYASKLNNTKGGIYANKGIVLFKLNRTSEACDSWQKAINLGEKSAKKYIDKYCK